MNRTKKSPKGNEDKEYIVTLAIEDKAKKGYEFYNDEIPSNCRDCELYQICMKNLEPRRQYEIVEIKDTVRHQCPQGLFDGDLVVVKVKESPLLVSFPARKAFAGMLIKFHPQPCIEKDCKYYENCNPSPSSIVKGMPVKCVRIIKQLKEECKFNHGLSLMEVKRKKRR